MDTEEPKKTLEEKRREARKKRIQGNVSDRLSYISSHTESLKNAEPTPEPTPSDNVANGSNQPPNLFDLLNGSNQTPQPKLNDPITFTFLRWSGVLFFSVIFLCIAFLSCSPQILEQVNNSIENYNIDSKPINHIQNFMHQYQWFIKSIVNALLQNQATANERGSGGGFIGTAQSIRQTIYTYGCLLAVWLVWEFLLVFKSRQNSIALKQKTFLSIARSDALLIAFFYTTLLDLTLRFKNEIFSFEELIYIRDNYVFSTIYYPIVIALIGQFIINSLLKINIVQMNPMINKVAQGLAHFILALFIVLTCIDWWECTSCYCKSFGLLYIISSKSRGLFLWAHICINFASRILPF
ncbi:hypothetical protein DICPUDRAFT_155977 [Dictyostelium purpureum]|uniref:Transmembrane protein n=1 Tax=Dictyostelium purpureum TaxID=5786 RepID=F0ZVD7_DICPU|nr:uncharacterized protein DICPUDRAFT_155977 [Dictyostelium purpureum]EGC32097.1 hypothetical protein DICPUDRAFT_155977 [Dictyostelium purpureum]|eukprot:XP_003291386.1 hypothetical protein DICPUDRAFT_155977 [Dictyostelium purpureum]